MADIYNGIDLDSEESGPKALRDALKAQKKQNEELQKKFDSLFTETRTRTVQDALKSKGLEADVAKFVPADADVNEWLAENGKFFGVKEDPAPQTDQANQAQVQGVDPTSALAQQFAQFQAAQAQATGVQTPAQANPMQAALEKAGTDGGANGIVNYLRSIGAAG